jgi:hypothetical protein
MKTSKKLLLAAALAVGAVSLTGCATQADTVSYNLSKEADSFKVTRQIVVYNGITNEWVAEITGLCSLGNGEEGSDQTTVTCKIGPDQYVKQIYRLGDNVSIISTQVEPIDADPYRYKVILKPEQVIPDIELQTSAGE